MIVSGIVGVIISGSGWYLIAEIFHSYPILLEEKSDKINNYLEIYVQSKFGNLQYILLRSKNKNKRKTEKIKTITSINKQIYLHRTNIYYS